MNNIYVDELPKGCKCGCPYCYYETRNTYYCALQNKYIEFFGDDYFKRQTDCPLKPLSDRLAEERKRVVQEIRKWCKQNFDYTKLPNELGCWVAVNREEFFDILDQIERGE